MTATVTFETIWQRIRTCQGMTFATRTGLSFAYEIEGSTALWVNRDGRRVDQRIPKSVFGTAFERVPLENTSAVKDLRGSSYVYGIMMNARIRCEDW